MTCVNRNTTATERRTVILDTNEVFGAAQDSDVSLVNAHTRRDEGALFAKRACLLIVKLLDLALVGRVDNGGHDCVRGGRDEDGAGRREGD